MAVIDLDTLPILSAVPEPLAASGWRGGEGGGAMFWEGRPGDRWQMAVETSMMKVEPDQRLARALLAKAERLGARVSIPMPDFNVMAPGSPVVATTTAAGRAVPIEGLTPRYPIRAGAWVTIVVDGRGYLDEVTDQVIANVDGEATISLRNPIRKSIPAGATVELGKPWIEGAMMVTRRPPIDISHAASFAFTIMEVR